jgi:hypothetical protein
VEAGWDEDACGIFFAPGKSPPNTPIPFFPFASSMSFKKSLDDIPDEVIPGVVTVPA